MSKICILNIHTYIRTYSDKGLESQFKTILTSVPHSQPLLF